MDNVAHRQCRHNSAEGVNGGFILLDQSINEQVDGFGSAKERIPWRFLGFFQDQLAETIAISNWIRLESIQMSFKNDLIAEKAR